MSYRRKRNESKERERQTTLRFLTNEAVAALAALLIVPLPRQVEVVVVGQNGAQGSAEHLVLLGCNTGTHHHMEYTEISSKDSLTLLYTDVRHRHNVHFFIFINI